MSLTIALRSACSTKASPLFAQIARLSSSHASHPLNIASKVQTVRLSPAQLSPMLRRALSTTALKQAAATSGTAPGHHAKLWTVERVLSAGLLFALPATIAFPSQPLDLVVAVSIVMHAHWGLEAIVVDYVRPILVGNVVPKAAHALLILFSAATLAGLVYFIQNDIGIGKAVRRIWAIKAEDVSPPAAGASKKKK